MTATEALVVKARRPRNQKAIAYRIGGTLLGHRAKRPSAEVAAQCHPEVVAARTECCACV
jgi:hypothetical protein